MASKSSAKPSAARALTRGNSTIVIGAGLLDVLAGFNGPATLTRIAEAAAMSPSRAYRYLRGLVDSGLLAQDPETGRYDLGPKILTLGLAAISRIDPVRYANAVLPDLVEETGLVATVSVWGSYGPTVIRCEHANLSEPIRIREGMVLPLLHTAAGHLFLAFERDSVTRDLLAREREEWNRAHSGRDSMTDERIEDIREEARKRGLTRAIGARKPLHANLAAPVFGRDGRLELVLTLIGVRGSYDTSYTGQPARVLRAAAKDLSLKLGAGEGPA